MNKENAGRQAYLAGASAECQVAADYERRGYTLKAQRWRGTAGEIDLIFNGGDEIVFVEVKKAGSFAKAALRISERQQHRICVTAEEYLGQEPRGLLTPMRLDAAFVNAQGEVRVLENAFGGA